jgi:para-nitrobenzyl esterase
MLIRNIRFVIFSLSVLSTACGTDHVDLRSGSNDQSKDDAHLGLRVNANAPIVQTTTGPLGGLNIDGGFQYLGIPYAEPPVGPRRFAEPMPKLPWRHTKYAVSAGSPCTQFKSDKLIGDEDCLFLNVFTKGPAPSPPSRPVMVFFHGGAFDNGSSMGPTPTWNLYNGAALSTVGDVVVVTVNYRLGALGFLVHPALRDPSGYSGNYGILDQIEALKWVQANISGFGGDPKRVTIFGESAGAMSVCTHVAQKAARGLFLRAIMQSGSCQAGAKKELETSGDALVEKLGCKDSDPTAVKQCLSSISAETIVRTQTNFSVNAYQSAVAHRLTFRPVVDGRLYDDHPIKVIEQGAHQPVDMIIGSNNFEIPGLVYSSTWTVGGMRQILTASGFDANAVQMTLKAYPAAQFGSPSDRLGAIATDIQFTCPALELASLLSAQRQKIFLYRFDLLGAFHGAELPNVFQSDASRPQPQTFIGQAWTSFASTGSPMTPVAPLARWDAFDGVRVPRMLIGETQWQARHSRVQQCAALKAAGVSIQSP